MQAKCRRAFVVLLVLINSSFVEAQLQADPFAGYINSIPIVSKVIEENQDDKEPVVVNKFVFNSRNSANSIYCVMAYPRKKGIYPAILFLHGGGSCADELLDKVKHYAAEGYVALAPDLPGIIGVDKIKYSDGPWKSRMKTEKAPRFNIKQGVANSILVDAEVAALEAFNYLRTQQNVDVNKIGITGYSWGGYSTTFLAGLLGTKVKAAYAVFGCGFYDKGTRWTKQVNDMNDEEKTTWLTYLDAGRRAPAIKAAYFLDAASNDNFFWPSAVDATLKAIPRTKNHVWNPNLDHVQAAAGPAMQKLYFDFYLKNKGNPFGIVKIKKIKKTADGGRDIYIKVDLLKKNNIQKVELYYSEKTGKWPDRKWISLPAEKQRRNYYKVPVAKEIVQKDVTYYAYVTDDRSVSTSSYMYEFD